MGRPLLLLKSSGMTVQVPMKSLFWLRRMQVQGNSPGDVWPCWRPGTGPEYDLVPHCLAPYTAGSVQPWLQEVWAVWRWPWVVAARGEIQPEFLWKVERSSPRSGA